MENLSAFDLSKSSGMVAVGVEELAKIIGYSQASVATWASTEPDKLPPRLRTGTNAARWLLADVWDWLKSRRGSEPSAAPLAVAPAPTIIANRKKRGRPPESVRLAAISAGMSTSEYISSQPGAR